MDNRNDDKLNPPLCRSDSIFHFDEVLFQGFLPFEEVLVESWEGFNRAVVASSPPSAQLRACA
eukprot:3932977-Amphidinium_carterae.1